MARERLAGLKRASGPVADAGAERGTPPSLSAAEAPPELRDLHTKLSALEVLRRAEHLASLGWSCDVPEWAVQREHGIDEQAAARVLLWAASGWLEADDVLDLVAWRDLVVEMRESGATLQQIADRLADDGVGLRPRSRRIFVSARLDAEACDACARLEAEALLGGGVLRGR